MKNNSVYANAKKGHKTEISKVLFDSIRKKLFKKNWMIDKCDIEEAVEKTFDSHFAKKVCEYLELTEEEKEIFKNELREKSINYIKEFARQKASPQQIYFYQSLCKEAEEEPKQLVSNFLISQEIWRLQCKIYKTTMIVEVE